MASLGTTARPAPALVGLPRPPQGPGRLRRAVFLEPGWPDTISWPPRPVLCAPWTVTVDADTRRPGPVLISRPSARSAGAAAFGACPRRAASQVRTERRG